jgi:hypothetical protein
MPFVTFSGRLLSTGLFLSASKKYQNAESRLIYAVTFTVTFIFTIAQFSIAGSCRYVLGSLYSNRIDKSGGFALGYERRNIDSAECGENSVVSTVFSESINQGLHHPV